MCSTKILVCMLIVFFFKKGKLNQYFWNSFFACDLSDESVEVLCELIEKGLLVGLQ